jgi:hypothetical protein
MERKNKEIWFREPLRNDNYWISAGKIRFIDDTRDRGRPAHGYNQLAMPPSPCRSLKVTQLDLGADTMRLIHGNSFGGKGDKFI